MAQVMNRVRGRVENPARLLQKRVPDVGTCRWPLEIDILPPGMQLNLAADILAGQMTFLNRTEQVGFPLDWRSDHLPKLWLYNLHYFEWLWALEFVDAKAAMLDWIETHPPAKGQQGWEPYPSSLRLMNICGVFWGKFKREVDVDAEFESKLWKSIYLQTEWLMSHLETHLLANHYLENAAALAFAGSCFDGDAAERWLNKGIKILESEIPEQILPDGMHFELSPMYHSRMLYVLAILHATENPRITELVSKPIQRMTRAMRHLCHPDGQIALFNDSAFGIYNEPGQLLRYCEDELRTEVGRRRAEAGEQVSESGVEATALQSAVRNPNNEQQATNNLSFSLPDAGYYGWSDQSGSYLIVDAGKVGPDYQPGHAHADLFSYELSLNGCRVIVDAGVHDYEYSELRRYSRSTAAHNTVEINGQDQSEVWGTFRVARRGIPKDIVWNSAEAGFKLSGSHNGYERLSGKPKHTRSVEWDGELAALSVCDRVKSGQTVRAISRIHLHPDCAIKEQGNQLFRIEYPAGTFEIKLQGSCSISIENSWYFPEFGKKIKNTVIELRAEGSDCEITYEVRSVVS